MKSPPADVIEKSEIFTDKGDFHGAIKVLSGFIEQNISNALAFALRGHNYFSLKEFAAAKFDFDSALNLEPNSPNTLFLRARCKEELNDLKGAEKDYLNVLSIDNFVSDAYLNLGLIYEYSERPEQARAIYEAAPQNGIEYDTIKKRLSGLN